MSRAIVGLAGLALLVAGLARAADPPFGGSWVRNDEASDDVEEKVREAARKMIEKAERRRRAAIPADTFELERRLARSLESLLVARERLEIELRDGELHVDDGEGRVRIYYLDGEKHLRQTRQGARLETTSVLRGRRVEVEQKGDEGGTIHETYAVAADGGRLELTVRLESKELAEPLVVRAVYDRER